MLRKKSNYLSHINRKKSCIKNDEINENTVVETNEETVNNTNIINYKCEKCNKEFYALQKM
jgi:hypothetical protein